MLAVLIDGQPFQFNDGISVLQALQQAGAAVPHLCHDYRLTPSGGCRMCVVEIEGETRPVASCCTPLADGMRIHSNSAGVRCLRKTNLSLLAARYPAGALKAEPEQDFHRLLSEYGVDIGINSGAEIPLAPNNSACIGNIRRSAFSAIQGQNRAESAPTSVLGLSPVSPYTSPYLASEPPIFSDDSHPYIGIDMSRCIQCQRCVRICAQVQGQFVWQTWLRGEQMHIAPADHHSLLTSGCTSCGACVDTCPTGALYDKTQLACALPGERENVVATVLTNTTEIKPAVASATENAASNTEDIEHWQRSTCVYCGVGCQLEVGSKGNKVCAIRPAQSPVNRGHLCVKGHYAYAFNHAPDRCTEPMLREGENWRVVSWDTALDYIAEMLSEIKQRDGADSIGVLGSARATNEDNFLAQKFARLVLGTNNVDCCARVCHAPSAKALKTMLGTGAATNCFDDIEHTSAFLLCGTNATENHPVVGARIKQAVLKGAKLIVIDPRRIELTDYADIHLALKPGTNVALFNAMAACLLEEQLIDREFIAQRVDGFDAFSAHIARYTPESVAEICGVNAHDIRAAARLYATSKPAMSFHGLGLTEHTQGSAAVMCLINLALLTGNLGMPGAGINPLRGQNNVQGSAQMGCEPQSLTGAQDLNTAGPAFAARWGQALPTTPGKHLLAMIDASNAGKFKALWAMGYDLYQSLAHAEYSFAALARLELLIVQDLFLTETARTFAHVFLPAASVFERDGTFMNSDRRVQRIHASIAAPGAAKPDSWIIAQVAARMGYAQQFDYTNAQAVWDEVRALWPAGAGLSYARIEQESLHWPCPHETHPGTPIMHRERFTIGPKATLACINYAPTSEQCDAHYPFLLSTGRSLYHFNAGTMSYRTANQQLRPSDTLDMAPVDAERLSLRNGERVLVSSRYGHVAMPLQISERIKPGELFCTFHRPDLMINQLTSDQRDGLTATPEYKVTAVQVNKLK